MSNALTFYFDLISPYAYIAWTQIHALAERHGREVEPVPVLFAALLNANGQKGPGEIPAKRAYIFKDVLRTAHQLQIPLKGPPSHPFNPLLALRACSLPMDAAVKRALVSALFDETWGASSRGVTDPAIIDEVGASLGLEGLAARTASREVKDALRANTEAALAAGAFGVPTMVVDGELFWGYDSFAHLDRALGGADLVDLEALGRLNAIKPSATR